MLAPRPTPTVPARWNFPTPVRTVLDNGIEVLHYHLPGQHVISATVVLDFSLSSEPAGHDGITSMVARTLTEGTTNYPGVEHAEQLENVGAAVGAEVGASGIHVLLDVPAPRLAAAGPLLGDAIQHAMLDPDDVRRQIDLRLAEIAQSRANSAATASTEWRRTVIDAESRFARPVGGDREPVARLSAEQVQQWYRTTFDAARATIIIGGDLTEDPTALAHRWLGGWTSSGSEPVNHTAATPAAAAKAVIFDRPGAVQADIRLGGWGIDRNDPRWAAARVAAYPMGGSFGSRLNTELRENRGYTYGVQLSFNPLRHGGWFALSGSFRTDVVGAALESARELLDISSAPLSAAEITDAQQYLLGSGPLQYATADGVVDQAAAQVSLGLSDDYLDRNLDAVLAVTPEQASEAFSSLVKPDQLSLVVVADAAAIADPIRRAGFEPEIVAE